MKKRLAMNSFILILTLCVSAELFAATSAATKRYSANFDDGTVAIPFYGNMQGFNMFGKYPADPSQYTFQPGRSGLALTDKTSRYGGSDSNIANGLYWETGIPWPTDEIYVSWWERHQVPYTTWMNVKMFRIWFDPNDDTGKNSLSWQRRPDFAGKIGVDHAVYDRNGTIQTEGANWSVLGGMTNGNWHHVEFYINFTGLTYKVWWDGNLLYTRTWDRSLFSWNRHFVWMFIGGPFTPGEPPLYGTFTRQMDDVEIWDGMPGTDRSILPSEFILIPRPPVNLNIK